MKSVVIFFLIIPFFCDAQLSSTSFSINSDLDLLKTTVWIQSVDKNDSANFGTAYYFFSNKKNKLYLVTNKHVVENAVYINVGVNLVESKKETFSIAYTIDSVQQKAIYFDTAKFADLAIIDYGQINYSVLVHFNIRYFSEKNLPSSFSEDTSDFLNENLIGLSFPGYLKAPIERSPYIIHSTFATPYFFDYGKKDEFCVNGNFPEGCSGSPIIYIRKDKGLKYYLLLGTIAKGYYSYRKIVKVKMDPLTKLPKPTEYNKDERVLQDLDLNVAIKSNKLLELLNSDF